MKNRHYTIYYIVERLNDTFRRSTKILKMYNLISNYDIELSKFKALSIIWSEKAPEADIL